MTKAEERVIRAATKWVATDDERAAIEAWNRVMGEEPNG